MSLSPADLQDRLSAFPRLRLAETPTPLERLPRLSKELGREIYVKREDELGPGLGGNKTRKLEFLLAEAQARQARRVATFGGLQSNHARLTAAAAVKIGLEPHLFYFSRRPERLTGNLLVNQLLGAKMHFINLGGSSGGQEPDPPRSLESTIRLVRWVARAVAGPNYFIPVGGHNWLGCLGYVQAALEVEAQARAAGIENGWLLTAAGTGGTLAGLLAGLDLLGRPLQLLGIDVGRLWKDFPASIARLSSVLCAQLGQRRQFTPQEIPLIEEKYVGRCYGQPSPECQDALRRAARAEGLLLDPVYTGKAFAGMLDLIRREDPALGGREPVIFLHTGGLPALFAFDNLEI